MAGRGERREEMKKEGVGVGGADEENEGEKGCTGRERDNGFMRWRYTDLPSQLLFK